MNRNRGSPDPVLPGEEGRRFSQDLLLLLEHPVSSPEPSQLLPLSPVVKPSRSPASISACLTHYFLDDSADTPSSRAVSEMVGLYPKSGRAGRPPGGIPVGMVVWFSAPVLLSVDVRHQASICPRR